MAEIKEIFGTTEAHARKVVQMNALARNLRRIIWIYKGQSLNMDRRLDIRKLLRKFQYITVEEFTEGAFAKYIDNTGEICGDVFIEIGLQAEAFVHFTYVNSNQLLPGYVILKLQVPS